MNIPLSKNLIIIVILVALVALVAVNFDKVKAQGKKLQAKLPYNKASSSVITDNADLSNIANMENISTTSTLYNGIAEGTLKEEIMWLQRAINQVNNQEITPLVVDGIFGPLTEQALQYAYQKVTSQEGVRSTTIADFILNVYS